MREFVKSSTTLYCWKYGYTEASARAEVDESGRVRLEFALQKAQAHGTATLVFKRPDGSAIAGYPVTVGVSDPRLGGVVSEDAAQSDPDGQLSIPLHPCEGRAYVYPQGRGYTFDESPIEIDLREATDGDHRVVKGSPVAFITAKLAMSNGLKETPVLLSAFPDWSVPGIAKSTGIVDVLKYTAFPLVSVREGIVTLDCVPPGAYRVLACFSSRPPAIQSVRVESHRGIELDFQEVPAEETQVYVRDVAGSPVAGAIVFPVKLGLNDIVQILNGASGLIGGSLPDYYRNGNPTVPGMAKCVKRLRRAGFAFTDNSGHALVVQQSAGDGIVTVFHPKWGLYVSRATPAGEIRLSRSLAPVDWLRVAAGPIVGKVVVAIVEDPIARIGGKVHPVETSFFLPVSPEGEVGWLNFPPGDYRVGALVLGDGGDVLVRGASMPVSVGQDGRPNCAPFVISLAQSGAGGAEER
ncbi:MAG: hypothetical protein L6R43_00495 [Planctomycetes bacterium]|nr:hypothetical protein [Planctomycetota bacterium]